MYADIHDLRITSFMYMYEIHKHINLYGLGMQLYVECVVGYVSFVPHGRTTQRPYPGMVLSLGNSTAFSVMVIESL